MSKTPINCLTCLILAWAQTAGLMELERKFCVRTGCFDRDQQWYRNWSNAVAQNKASGSSAATGRRNFGRKPNQFDDKFMNDLNTLIYSTGMIGVQQRRHLVSQAAHETGRYRWMKELGDDDYFTRMYDNRPDLGNGPGDGKIFYGGGCIQLTGRYNYQRFSDWLERNGMRDDTVMQKGAAYVANTYPFLSAVCWIQENGWASVCEGTDIVTRVLNGGYNGIEDRLAFRASCEHMRIIN